MQIGEFAKLCGANVSLLRHYDKLGLLSPVYTDRVTGYRYYSPAQVETFRVIGELKKAGFSLNEIEVMLEPNTQQEEIARLFDRKKAELTEMLGALEQVKDDMDRRDFMNEEELRFHEDIDFPFVDDPQAVGKWQVLGIWNSVDDFYLGKEPDDTYYDGDIPELYFLVGGEEWWGWRWTKGKFINNAYQNARAEDYRIEEIDGETYMLIDHKSYEYLVSGKTDLLVLKKIDNTPRSKWDIGIKDDIDMPFVDDPAVIGKWKTWGFLGANEPFSTEQEDEEDQYWKSVEFFPGGHVTSVYEDEVIEGDDKQTWTKGCLLRKFNYSACAYEIKTVDGVDYLIVEWKSGDYRWGGLPTNYYTFVRDNEQ